jgi:type IV pilus assembly protein PilV
MMHKQLGIGLIEVLVTITITTIGLLGLSAMQMQSIRSVSDSGNRTHAIWIANDLLNRIRANEVATNTYITGEIECSDDIPETPICASYFDGANQLAPII